MDRLHSANRPSAWRWLMLLLLSLPNFGTNYAQFQLSAFAADFMADFGIGTAQFSAVALSFTIVTGIVGVAGGTLADKYGVRRVTVICGFITGAVSLLRLLFHSYAAFFAFSLFMGAFLGCANATSGKIIRAWFPERQIGLAFAIYAGIGAVGISLAQLMAPVYSGYRQALFAAGLVLLSGPFLWLLLGRDAPRGAVLPPSQPFLRHLSRVARLRNLWIAAAALACFNALIFSLSALLPTVLSADMGLDVTAANRTASLLNFAAILGMIVLPLLQAPLGQYRPLLVALMLITAALTASIRIAPQSLLLPQVCLTGFFMSVGAPFLMAMLSGMPDLDAGCLGSATGLVTLVQYLVGGFILPSWVIAPLVEESGSALFLCAAALALLIGLGALLLPETGEKRRSNAQAVL